MNGKGNYRAGYGRINSKSFQNNNKWIARRLEITPLQAEQAIHRLIRIGILEESEDGVLTDVTEGNTSHLPNNFTSEQLRDFQIHTLEKAIKSLQTVPVYQRDNTSMTMAINKNAIPFAKQEITKFRRKLTKQLEAFDKPDEVYQLAISLTPLTVISNHGDQ